MQYISLTWSLSFVNQKEIKRCCDKYNDVGHWKLLLGISPEVLIYYFSNKIRTILSIWHRLSITNRKCKLIKLLSPFIVRPTYTGVDIACQVDATQGL